MTGIIEPAIFAIDKGAEWLATAVKNARDKKIVRAANILHDSGVVVVGLREISNRAQRLLFPLTLFDPAEWPKKRRASTVGQLSAFAREETVAPRVHQAIRSLEELLRGWREEAETVDTANKLKGAGESALYRRSILAVAIEDLVRDPPPIDYGGLDVLLSGELPGLASSIRNARGSDEVRALTEQARRILDEQWSDLAKSASIVEEQFGRLSGHLRRRYPRLPAPNWTEQGTGNV